ncbi:MAG: PIN domain-containing protein [Chloroflexi bacterium]|nr:PIN domain-containing protein [Chloroflexota bacterium]
MKNHPSASSSRVFIDTSAYFALADDDDTNYHRAQAILTQLANQCSPLFTTTFVVAKTHTLLLARLNQHIATKFLKEIENSSTTVVHPTLLDLKQARATVYKYADKNFSFTDAISFAVMERMNISYALSFDRHFAQYGFHLLTAGKP